MRYLLDTNILSDLLRNPRGRVAENILRVGENQVCTSIIVAAELRYGIAKKGSARLRGQLAAIFAALAAHALALGHTVVTDNEREFSRIPELSVENWLR
jgi:tRNA(fMet)-specific endonuclease VapC